MKVKSDGANFCRIFSISKEVIGAHAFHFLDGRLECRGPLRHLYVSAAIKVERPQDHLGISHRIIQEDLQVLKQLGKTGQIKHQAIRLRSLMFRRPTARQRLCFESPQRSPGGAALERIFALGSRKERFSDLFSQKGCTCGTRVSTNSWSMTPWTLCVPRLTCSLPPLVLRREAEAAASFQSQAQALVPGHLMSCSPPRTLVLYYIYRPNLPFYPQLADS